MPASPRQTRALYGNPRLLEQTSDRRRSNSAARRRPGRPPTGARVALLAVVTLGALGALPACRHADTLVTTPQVLTLVRDTRIPAGHAACAVFDADGTLWDFDLSSALVQETLRDRTAGTAGLPAMNASLRSFGLPAEADVYAATRAIDAAFESGRLHAAGRARGWGEDEVAVRVWPHYNWLFVGLAPAELAERARRLVRAPAYRARAFAGVRAVVAALRRRGVRVVVISGGVHEFVAAATAALGFAPDAVRGLRLRVRDDRLTAEVDPPVPYQQGKAVIARELCGGAPTFAFGDSVASGDAAMLDLAAVPVAVRPRGRHHDAARTRRLPTWAHPEEAAPP